MYTICVISTAFASCATVAVLVTILVLLLQYDLICYGIHLKPKTWCPIFEKSYDDIMIWKSFITKLWRNYNDANFSKDLMTNLSS